MGFFDGGEPDNRTNDLLDKQLAEQEAERQEKRKAYFQQQLAVIDSHSGQNWGTPKPTKNKIN